MVAMKQVIVLLALVALGGGCDSRLEDPEAGDTWRPLAVLSFGGTDLAGTEGIIRITTECVFLTRRGEDTLLLWPDVLTTWVAEDNAVVFERIEGIVRGGELVVTVVDGDLVVVGGGAGPPGSDAGEAWIDSVDWVEPPSPQCVTPGTWAVGDITHLEP
jgi:hypothetical protein